MDKVAGLGVGFLKIKMVVEVGGIKLSGNLQRNEGMGWVFNFSPSLKGLLRVGGWGFLFPFFQGVVSWVG
jgi:hypothetical protein